MLRIGDFSKLSRISIRMLRHYDEMGLLVPESTDAYTGYRYYSEAQLILAGRILALRDMGFGLSVIADILHTYHDSLALRQYLLLKKTEIQAQLEKANRQLLLLDTTISRLGKDETTMEYQVSLKEMPARKVASLRRVIPEYAQEGLLWAQLRQELAPQSVRFANPCHTLAVYHDREYKEQDPDVEIQITVDGDYQDTEHVRFKSVEPVRIASATYQGSYEQIGEVYHAVAQWIADNQYDFAGCMFTIYHVSPAQTQNPEELVTEVCFPVKEK